MKPHIVRHNSMWWRVSNEFIITYKFDLTDSTWTAMNGYDSAIIFHTLISADKIPWRLR